MGAALGVPSFDLDFGVGAKLMAKYHILWVASGSDRRDYKARQLYANDKGAVCYIEGHYNAKVYDKPGTADNPASCLVASNSGSKTRNMAAFFAAHVHQTFGYPNGGCVVTEPGIAGYWNLYYAKGNSLLLEPLYVSDPEQAIMAQSELGQDRIAQIINTMVRKFYPDGGVIAFSVGHKYKVSSPYDRGAPVVGTDGLGEADLAELYMKKAAVLLETETETKTETETEVETVPVEVCDVSFRGTWEIVPGVPGQTRLVRVA